MTTPAQTIIQSAAETLQDLSAVRWGTAELVRYLNAGQLETVMLRPDANTVNATFTCAAGAKQTLPANAVRLLDVTHNVAATSSRGVVRMINRNLLDNQVPNWYAQTGSVNIKHFMLDVVDRNTFYVFPPAFDTAQVNIVYAAYPAAVAIPAPNTTFTAVTGNIAIPDIFANALVDYVLYKAFAKDAELQSNAARAQAHYAAYGNALGVELKSAAGVTPTPRGNPTRAG
jgi:hypothetical protein